MHSAATTRFRLKAAFAAEPSVPNVTFDGVLCDEPMFRVSAAILEHHTPCLGFALQEAGSPKYLENRVSERGLPVGPWLRPLKRAVLEGRPDDHFIQIDDATSGSRLAQLGDLRDLLTVTAGQKIGYVTDVADTPANRAAIIALIQNVDLLYIQAAFAARDAQLARQRGIPTTTAAGERRRSQCAPGRAVSLLPALCGRERENVGRGVGGVRADGFVGVNHGRGRGFAGTSKIAAALPVRRCMSGRGIDQVMAHPCSPEIYEDYMRSAEDYVLLAERANGPIPRRNGPSYIWGAALENWSACSRMRASSISKRR